jgi:hypothetical protein
LDPDAAAYRRSVRNMVAVLAAMAIIIFAAIFVPPYINPAHEVFQPTVSYDSTFGFTMHLTLNSTSIVPGQQISIDGWLNSTSTQIENVSASDQWAFQPSGELWQNPCMVGWPIGIGIMQGHYTQDNFTLGTLMGIGQSPPSCPAASVPQYFLLYPLSSKALVDIGGSPAYWTILTRFGTMGVSSAPPLASAVQLPPGVYTVVLADEWGDVLTANFVVS